MQVIRSTRFRPRSGKAAAAEGLHADHRADHVAVDVDIPDLQSGGEIARHRVYARMNAEGQPELRVIDRSHDTIERARRITNHVQDRPEDFTLQALETIDLHCQRRNEGSLGM